MTTHPNVRTEADSIGEMEIPADALFGIHSLRAFENFPDRTPFNPEWYRALGLVKLAFYQSCSRFYEAVSVHGHSGKIPMALIPADRLLALSEAAREVSEGMYFDQFIVPAISGGAGTSINMNVNEIIANAALLKTGRKPGEYSYIDPIEQANIYQSTNDVIPTSLKVAAMKQLPGLESAVNGLREGVEKLETAYRNELRIAFTQMQEAVPSSYGKLFAAYSEALSRDWWRVSKCFERIKVVNLGGSAIGTGLGVPTYIIMDVISALQRLSGLPVTRSENMTDATSNLDAFVEVHATLKSLAVNLEKMVSDLRLLASDIAFSHEITLPARQVGSSIMPGKINPVIPEYVVSVAHKIYANDQIITSLCASGCLELNAYIPLIGHSLLESISLLTGACITLRIHLIDGLKVNQAVGLSRLLKSPAVTTALVPYIGYHPATQLAKYMKETGCTIFEANQELKLVEVELLQKVLQPSGLLRLGFSVQDIVKELGGDNKE